MYGFRQSLQWWSDERDNRLRKLRFTVDSHEYYLQQNDADSQLWMLIEMSTDKFQRRSVPSTASGSSERRRENPSTEESPYHRCKGPSIASGFSERRQGVAFDEVVPMDTDELLGLICVYVSDFLAIAPEGPIRDALIQVLTSLWEFGPERVLSEETSLTFLGIDWIKRSNGDIFLTQERFTKELLEKHNMLNCNHLTCITMTKPQRRMTSQAQSCLPSYNRTLVPSTGWLPGPGQTLPTIRVFWHLAHRSQELGAVMFPRKCFGTSRERPSKD